MKAGALKAALIACTAISIAMQNSVHAEDYYREDLRIPMAAAGTAGLEAMLLRPSGTRRYPLALISHGSPRDEAARATMSPYGYYRQALEFARRGFAALVVMRRGYGRSGGDYAESSGPCGRRDYLLAAKTSASDLRAAIEAMRDRTDVSINGMIAVGVSAGGFASLALSADPPPGLVAAISFAGGRGSRGDHDVCDQPALINSFSALGQKSRIPTLWIYAQNDKFFWPDLAHQFYAAFTAAGGKARFIDAPASGQDGHLLFSEGVAVWTPMIDDFLREQNLGTRDLAALPAPATLPPPGQLGNSGRAAFAAFLAASPHKAFAVAPNGSFAWRTGQRSVGEAQDAALTACAKYRPDCALYAVDNDLAGAGAGSGPSRP